MVGLDGTDDGVEILFASRCILQHQTFLHGSAVCQYAMHGERGEEPALDAVVTEHLLVADEVLIRLWLAVNDDAKHVEDGIAMAVERRAIEWIAVSHAVVLPLLVQFFEGQFAIGPERIDDPDVLVKYLSWFHACKSSESFQETGIVKEYLHIINKTNVPTCHRAICYITHGRAATRQRGSAAFDFFIL